MTTCERDSACPLIAVHKRLFDVYQLWKQAADSYFDPENFRVNLNACIESLRSVTWILQKNKSSIPNFEPWYAEWQKKMKEDSVLAWCVQARNKIVKEGDLETNSTVRVSVFSNWNEPPFSEFNVPPFIPTELIATNIEVKNIPNLIKKNGLLSVERRWICSDLPDFELLDALAHAFGFLSSLLKDIHQKLSIGYPIKDEHQSPDGRLPLMISLARHRTVYIKLASGEQITQETSWNEIPESVKNESQIRYNLPSLTKTETTKPLSLLEESENYFEIARRILEKDGHHVHIVILKLPNNRLEFLTLDIKERAERFMIWSRVAEQVEQQGAYALITIGEAFMAPYDSSKPLQSATDSLDRSEVLQLVAASAQGEEHFLVAWFERIGKTIKIGPTHTIEGKGPSFLNPVRKILAKVKK